MPTGIERGDIWLANLDPAFGHEIKKTRPTIVIQNNAGNSISNLMIIAPVTSQKVSQILPFEAFIPTGSGLSKPSKALLDQIRTVDKRRLIKRLGRVDAATTQEIDEALRISLGLVEI